MSQNHPETTSNLTYDLVFENALKAYKKKTGKDLTSDPLLRRLETCNSPDGVLGTLREQVPDSDQPETPNDRLMNWLDPTVNVLLNFSEKIGSAVSPVYPPAGLIFVGISSLLSVVQAVSATQDEMISLFERIENFFRRLEMYIGLPRTTGMMEIIVKVMTEVLIILGLATREVKQGKIKRFLKKLIGRSDIKDALQRLDNLMQEESRMAAAQGLKATHGLEERVVGIKDDVQGVGDMLRDVVIDGGERLRGELQRKQLQEDLEKWLSPPDPSINYNTASSVQHKGTAAWFTNGNAFIDWKESGSLLWIHGKPGSGKSVLTSAIIQDINGICTAGSAHLAYFFFDFKDISKQDIRALLSSLIVQLSNQSPSFYDILLKFYSAHRDGSQQPNVRTLTQCLENMLKVQEETPIYVIIDALDECPDTSGVPSLREEVLELVRDLIESHFPILRLCVTSRPEIDIRNVLDSLTSTSNRISLHDQDGQRQDIVDYVTAAVSSDSKMKRWREEDKTMVVETLSERADGMFRWVFCQLEALRHCLPPSVRQTVAELPRSLDETYKRILQEIPRANWVHAHRLLQCLAVAKRPLSVEDLAEVLAIDFPEAGGIPTLKEGFRWEDQEQAVLSACSSLIIVVQDWRSRRVQFSHFSVKEFLTSDRLAKTAEDGSDFYHIRLDSAHTIMAQACLGVLLGFDDQMDKETMKSYPLAKYAVEHVTDHADFENVISHISDGLDDLFDTDKPHFDIWCRLWCKKKDHPNDSSISLVSSESSSDSDDLGDNADESRSDSKKAGPDLDHTPATSDQSRPAHPFSHYSLGMTPLHRVMGSQCPSLVQYVILKRPQDLHVRFRGFTPPQWAVFWIDDKVLRLMPELFGDVDASTIKGLTVLHVAASEGRLEPVRMLVERHAAINARDHKGRTPLYCAMYEAGNESHDESDAFGCARFLLENGADVDAQDNRGWAPLHRATYKEDIKFVQLLLGHGANTNLRNDKGETALHRLRRDNVDIARLLIDHDVDMDAQDNKGSTPLHLAISGWGIKVTQLLLERGANVDVQNNEGSTPLHMAASEGETGIAKLLLERGANVQVQNDEGLTPLDLTVSAWNDEITELLLEHGANLHVQNKDGSTLLHLAASRGMTRVSKLLLERGTNVDVQNNEGSTPLHMAASEGDTRIAELLLERGANVHVQNNEGSTPLHLAASDGDAEIVRLLRDCGADVHVQNNEGKTPLQVSPQWAKDLLWGDLQNVQEA